MEPIHSDTAVYMMASRKHGTLYIGVTGALIQRISQHREKAYGLASLQSTA